MAAPVLPVVFPFQLQSADPNCTTESARLLSDRIREVRQQYAVVLGLPLDTNITEALRLSDGIMGTVGQASRYVDTTHFLLSAAQVMTRQSRPGFHLHTNPADVTNDLGVAGPVVNGRDQAAAFTANVFVHLYWIYNDITLGSLSSLAPPFPGPGPVLPAGYARGAYAGAVLLDASANLVPATIRGRWTHYKALRQVATGTTYGSGTLQAISMASAVPVNAVTVRAQLECDITGALSLPATVTINLFDGLDGAMGNVIVGAESQESAGVVMLEGGNFSQTLKITVPGGNPTKQATVRIQGFENPNGG